MSTKCHWGWCIQSEFQEGKAGNMVVKRLDRNGYGTGDNESSVCGTLF